MWLFILIRLETIFPPGEGAGNQFGGINFGPTSREGQDLQWPHRQCGQRTGPRTELNSDNYPNVDSQQVLPQAEQSPSSYLDIIIMGWQALRSSGCYVHIWANQGAKVAFQLLLDPPKLILKNKNENKKEKERKRERTGKEGGKEGWMDGWKGGRRGGEKYISNKRSNMFLFA